MAPTRVVVLSGHSLFADGTASRLEQHSADVATSIVDPGAEDVIDRLQELDPDIAIIDSNDPNLSDAFAIPRIFRALPGLSMILLDSQSEEIQILTSRTHRASSITDLLAAIDAERL